MEVRKLTYHGIPECVEVQSGDLRLVATTVCGPRILHCSFVGEDNLFGVYDNDVQALIAQLQQGDTTPCFRFYGGHRLWWSPERQETTYHADNTPVNMEIFPDKVVLSKQEKVLCKEMTLIPKSKGEICLQHRLVNTSENTVQAAAWAITVMAKGGVANVYFSGEKTGYLPNRFVSFWEYTSPDDERLQWFADRVQVAQTPSEKRFKIGLSGVKSLSYERNGVCFEKSIDAQQGVYPDGNCNGEIYTDAQGLELETLSPLYVLSPQEEIVWQEVWRVTRTNQA